MTDAVKLKPCPFCDGATRIAKSPISQDWRVGCVECWSAGPPSASEEGRIERWNTRAPIEKEG